MKLSIIVPVYNVEDYLDRCLNSIINQNFVDYELILVDDGSTDSSGLICDNYEKKDPRIIVIHKKNGGLSSARNAGLDIARGEYIGFVDSDDWISPSMYESLITMCENFDLDLAVCGVQICYDEIEKNHNYYSTPKDNIMNKEEALKALFSYHYFGEEAWNKVYKKELFTTLRYPEGKIHEDTYCICDILDKCSKIGYSKEIGYFYYQRQDSIMNKSSTPSIDKIKSVDTVLTYLKNYNNIFFECSAGLLSAPLKNIYILLNDKTSKNIVYLSELKNFYLKYRQVVIKNKYITKAEKLIMLSVSVSTKLTRLILKVRKILKNK